MGFINQYKTHLFLSIQADKECLWNAVRALYYFFA